MAVTTASMLAGLAFAGSAAAAGTAAGMALKPVLNPKKDKAPTPAVPAMPTPPDATADAAAAEAAAQQAKTKQRAKPTNGRRRTLLTDPQTLGDAPVVRKSLLGL